MNHITRIALIGGMVLTLCSTSPAQYFGERVMEKSFEHADFFFTPYRFVPFGIGAFRHSVAGVLDDPLLNLDVNPAYLHHDSARSSYLYLDFRSAREIRDSRDFFFPYPIIGIGYFEDSRIIPYPRFYIRTRRELEPVVSAAILHRPVQGALKNLALGVTYQLVSQDERYYPIPQDIYRSVLGVDYMGVRSAATENIPIVDKFSGTDNIHQQGHFISTFAGYQITPRLQLSMRDSLQTLG